MQTLLKRNDRISMKNSVEIRCPFLDINLIKLIPKKTKYRKQVFLKKFFDKKILNLLNKQKKIGFFVPLLKFYGSNKKRINEYLSISLNFLKLRGLHINKNMQDNKEIKWVLLNIGIFLKQHE